MRVWKDLARGFGAALVVLLVLALGPVSAAMAAPTITISSPTNGASINTHLPAFSGTSTDSTPLDTITLNVYEGTSPGTKPFATATTPGEGTWSVNPGKSLPDGTYTAVAEQAQLLPPETGTSTPVIFTVDTVKPAVTLNAVLTPTNNPTPTLAGAAGTEEGDSSTVQVTVHEGSLGGPVFATAAVSKTGGTWSYTTPNLPDGAYTAQATQVDEAGNTGTSEAVKFTVHTTPPPVTLNPVTSTHDPTPTLEGAAGTGEFDFPTVHVVVHEGSVSGKEVASGNQSVSAGKWSYTTPHLEDGTYTARATQSDKAGNTGSAEVTFSVHTVSPTVTLNSIVSPSNNRNPSFTGTATDTTPVTVEIHEGPATGPIVSKASATNTPGNWSSGPAGTALEGGQYTAVAIQASSVGTEPGKSQPVAFTVVTSSPNVTLNSIKSPSNNTRPSFTGTATDTTPVIVEIHQGSAAGTVVSTATATNTPGSWTSGKAETELGDGQYTAVATQGSSLGNAPGSSNPVTFTVDTIKPPVSLNGVPSPTNNPTPTLSGGAGTDAGDNPTVAVTVYEGAVGGTVAASGNPSVSGGTWSVNTNHLHDGTYAAQAKQSDNAGNTGTSGTVIFTVNTVSPTVTLNQPASPSNNTNPSFSGFANDTTPVTIRIYPGGSVKGSAVSTAVATNTPGSWTSAAASPALSSGQYTAQATQESAAGNPAGVSEARTFTVNTGPPTVTLNPVKSPSNNTKPSFTGTASDTTAVAIQIYAGATAQGQVVSEAAASGTGGSWTSGQSSAALVSGQYTAVATQESSLLGNPAGTSSPVTFIVDTSSPTVTLNPVKSPSNITKPSFSGTATDTTQVVVHIYSAAHEEISRATATPSGGKWSSGPSTETLGSGSYTAIASQPSSLGNPAGSSESVPFTVETQAPKVTMSPLAVRSSNTTPSFTGTASETLPVTVRVYSGPSPTGTVLRTISASPSGGSWTTANVSPPLSSGVHEYTAVASEESSLGNGTGTSKPVTFTVDTGAPTVIFNPPASPSNNTEPSFTGTASDFSLVTVEVYAGATVKGSPVANAAASGTGGAWSSGKVNHPLSNGEYTAIAKQESTIGNGFGTSAPVTFIVNTLPPTVTLSPVKSPSNNSAPSFTGTATDPTSAIVVHIYAGASEISSVTAPAPNAKHEWVSGPASLPKGKLTTYTAVATQASSIGNLPGESKGQTFAVDTEPPTVTMVAPKSPSNNKEPSFSGTASDTTAVTVKIYLGTKAEGAEVASATALAPNAKHEWTAGKLTAALSTGLHTYTAVATQSSSLGNPVGVSAPATFVVNTEPPAVVLNQPASPSNVTAPSFKGIASDNTPVTVRIYLGATPPKEGVLPVATATAPPPNAQGEWTSAIASPVLASVRHIYTAVATQESSIPGNPAGKSSVTFIVDPAAPFVTVNAPPPLSNNATPAFTGTTNHPTTVTVSVYAYAGGKRTGLPVASATAPGPCCRWASGSVSPRLPDGQYTAVASQESELKVLGESEQSAPFTIDTIPPQVSLSPLARTSLASGESLPVQGSADTGADDLPGVRVRLFSGASIAGSPVREIGEVTPVAGAWSTTLAGISPGTYTVDAAQFDKAGNEGLSSPRTFVVAAPPTASTPTPLAASFVWFPTTPHTGEHVSLASSSTDGTSPITGFAWDLLGNGAFQLGPSVMGTTFSTPGGHVVRLRVTDALGVSSVATGTIPVTAAPLVFMRPFPIVRIVTTRTSSGVKLRLLSVQAPRGARISVQCKGHGCPARSQSAMAAAAKKKGSGAIEFRRFQRSLPAGVSLEIRISKAGQIGKYTRLTVRSVRLPLRVDACLSPASLRPMACPLS